VDKLLWGLKGTSITVEIKTPDNKIKKLDLLREPCKDDWLVQPKKYELVTYKQLNSDIAYISINNFRNYKTDSLFCTHIQELQKCKGLIIDIRENSGGNSEIPNSIIKRLSDKPYFLCEHGSTRKLLSTQKAWGVYSAKELLKYNLDTTSSDLKNNFKSPEFRAQYRDYQQYLGNV
jgi:C-terminal processing protease CtpA/Prc